MLHKRPSILAWWGWLEKGVTDVRETLSAEFIL